LYCERSGFDKTGTITEGNRRATQFLTVEGDSTAQVGELAALASAADETPEGKSIVSIYESQSRSPVSVPQNAEFITFSASTRMSGINLSDGRRIRKGAADTVMEFVREQGGSVPTEASPLVDGVASRGATPLVVADGPKIVGVVVLEDILKPAMKERFNRLRKMGLRTVMITGDNPLTAATWWILIAIPLSSSRFWKLVNSC
jgi:K+-transporting ATPase ATPase B chain